MFPDQNMMEYIDSLESDIPGYLLCMENEALQEEVPVIRKQVQALLRFFIKLHKPGSILEIGAAVGFSASFMSEYMPEGCRLTTIEKIPAKIEKARKNFEKAERGADISLLEGDAYAVLEGLACKKLKYDFIFLDAAKAQYMHYLPLIIRLLKDGGLFITDNVLQDGTVTQSRYGIARRERTIHARMREFLHAVKHMQELETIVLPSGDGVSVSYKIRKQGERVGE